MCALARQLKARHYVGNDKHIVAVDFANARFAIVRVRDCEQRVGVAVIDELVRNHRVQNRFHRRRRRARADHVGRQLIYHLWIGECLEVRQFQQRRQPHRRESSRLDHFQIPAGAFDVKNFLLVAGDIALAHFYRSIAAAVKNERVVAAEKARTVNAQLKIGFAVCGFSRVPKIPHRSVIGPSPIIV